MSELEETLKRVEAKRQAQKQEQRERDQQNKELANKRAREERYNQAHWKEIAWKALSKDRFEYAVWYNHKRLVLLNMSWILVGLLLVDVLVHGFRLTVSTYFSLGVWVGIVRAIATDGQIKYGTRERIPYSFFEGTFLERLKFRFNAFLLGLAFPFISLLYHVFDYVYVLSQLSCPAPPLGPSDSSYDDGPSEHVVGRVASDGTIYRRDD